MGIPRFQEGPYDFDSQSLSDLLYKTSRFGVQKRNIWRDHIFCNHIFEGSGICSTALGMAIDQWSSTEHVGYPAVDGRYLPLWIIESSSEATLNGGVQQKSWKNHHDELDGGNPWKFPLQSGWGWFRGSPMTSWNPPGLSFLPFDPNSFGFTCSQSSKPRRAPIIPQAMTICQETPWRWRCTCSPTSGYASTRWQRSRMVPRALLVHVGTASYSKVQKSLCKKWWFSYWKKWHKVNNIWK